MKKTNLLAASLFIAALVAGAFLVALGTNAQATPVACSPVTTSVGLNSAVTFTASGGTGNFTWASSGTGVLGLGDPTSSATTRQLTFTVPGNYAVTVSSGGATATCVVAVSAVEAPDPGPSIEAPAPGLPNTGELPL